MDSQRWQRLSPLLDALLELEPDARAEHLATLRAQDAGLADELEHLLKLDAEAPEFLDTPALSLPNGPIPGARIGPYRMERLLGEGGMGQVWLAERADGLYERKVALKLLRPGLADPRLHQRFIREREILARFEHPNIARLLDAGTGPDGQPYLALEYVEGEPLVSYCQSRQLDIPARLALFRDVCEAVSHAHANLIVHRDLKPSNILVTPAGHVRLLDFGIAKLLDAEPVPVEQTRTGVRTFTLHYAAPEQIRGEPVTTMTDVYSLGVVLYELLTGCKPYQLKRETDAEWEEAIIEGEPQRPSLAASRASAERVRPYSPSRLSKLLSGDLDNIVLKALSKAPAQRYPSVEALAQDIGCHLRGRPVQARGESVGYRLRKYLYRHRWGLATASTILVVLVAALGLVTWQAQRALREAGRAQAMQHFVTELFEDAGSSANTPIDVRSLLDMGILRGERSLARQPQARAELYGVVARLRLGLGDYREAGDLLERQAKLLAVLPDAPASLRLEAATLRGNVHQELGEPVLCTNEMQPLETAARREELQLALVVATFYSQLGRCRRDLGEADAAKRLYARALELRRKENDVGGVAETQLDLATLQSDAGQPEAAIRTLTAALDQLRQRAGDHHPMAIDMRRSLCVLERATDAFDAALRDCRASLALAQELHGRNHRTTIDANRQLAALYVDLGRFNEAETIFLDTTAWMRARLDPNHPDMARAYNNLAIVAWERGDGERALRFERQAVAAWRKSGNPGQIANGQYNLAMILHSDGREREALDAVLEAIQLRARQFGVDNGLVGDGERLRGEILAALGQREAARAALEQAVRVTQRGYRKGHSHTRRAEIALARLRAQDGDGAAIAQLTAQSQRSEGDIEQHKAAWLAGAYAAEAQCRSDGDVARAQLDTVLSQMQLALPEGGAVPREIRRIREACVGVTQALAAKAGQSKR
ncbi:serine/threonine-protein kinase [Thermomonas sp.]|uniref:serine/threonine-protein kinase n=1 Tax=Thermomonas sp. TaxID=1971895 RepID=UPI00260FBD23|nr:serine/threonine-protein kinase [Thermomonas sp.]